MEFLIVLIIVLVSIVTGLITGMSIMEHIIKEDLLTKYKYRINNFYVINGSVDKELK